MWINKQTNREVDVRDYLYEYYDDYFDPTTLEEWIDECYDPIEVAGYTFPAGQVLFNCLPGGDWYYIKQDFVESSVSDDYYDIETTDWHEGESPNSEIRAVLPDFIIWTEKDYE